MTRKKRSTLGSLLAKSTATNVNEKRGNVTDRKQKKAPTLTLFEGSQWTQNIDRDAVFTLQTFIDEHENEAYNFLSELGPKMAYKDPPHFLSCITGCKNAKSHPCLFWNHWPEKGDTNTHILLCSVVTDRKKPNTHILLWSLTAKNTKRGTV